MTLGKPCYERVVTVSGGATVDPRNVLVRIGTPVQNVLDYLADSGRASGQIGGGPMTGPPIVDFDGPVVKTLSGISALTQEEAGFDENKPCIRCARCVNACPMGLTPNFLGEY